MHVLVLDIGTTNIKALVFDQKLHVHFQRFYPVSTQEYENCREQDPLELLNACEDLIRAARKELESENFDGIALSAAMHSLIVIGPSGTPITKAMIWSDNRAEKEAKEIRDRKDSWSLFADTGTPIHPMTPLFKTLWLKRHHPEILVDATRLVGIKDYIIERWSGQWLTDYATASATGFFDFQKMMWSERSVRLAGINSGLLPQLLRSTTFVPCPIAVQNNIFRSPEKVMLGGSDGCYAGLPEISGATMSLTIGTSAAIRCTHESPMLHPDGLLFNYLYHPGKFVIGGASNNGGNLLQWYFKHQIEDKSLDAGNFAQFWEKVLSSEPSEELFLPYVFGERAPLWDPSAKPYFNLEELPGLDPLNRARSVVEGMMMNLKLIYELFPASYRMPEIIISGGLFSLKGSAQLLSDILGLPLKRLSVLDLSAVGAATQFFVAAGVEFDSGSLTREVSTINPEQNVKKHFSERFLQFRDFLDQKYPLFKSRNRS